MNCIGQVHLPEAIKPPRSAPVRDPVTQRLLLEGLSSRIWAFRSPFAGVSQTALRLRDSLSDGYFLDACVGERVIVIDAEAETCVFDLVSGRLLLNSREYLRAYDGVCLLPGGHLLLCLDDDHAAVLPLDDVVPHAEPIADLALDQPASAIALARPGQADSFELVLGCYGYASVQALRMPRGSAPVIDAERLRTPRGALIYDLVAVAAAAWPWVFLLHGGGAGLCAWNVSNGSLNHCPRVPTAKRQPESGMFLGAVPFCQNLALVRIFDGWMRWDLGDNTQRLCGNEFVLLGGALDGIWAIDANRSSLLLKFAT